MPVGRCRLRYNPFFASQSSLFAFPLLLHPNVPSFSQTNSIHVGEQAVLFQFQYTICFVSHISSSDCFAALKLGMLGAELEDLEHCEIHVSHSAINGPTLNVWMWSRNFLFRKHFLCELIFLLDSRSFLACSSRLLFDSVCCHSFFQPRPRVDCRFPVPCSLSSP